MFMKNKRGQGMSTSTIILLILGLVVLVVLILGFTIGWGKMAPWLSTTNVDTIAISCEAACTTGSTYDYCSAKRDLKAEDVTLKDVTCYYLSIKQLVYGIDGCPSSSCDSVILSEGTDLATAQSECLIDPANSGKIVQYLDQDTLKFETCA